MSGEKIEQNPELCTRLSKPFQDQATANEAVTKFLAGVQSLREECGIPEVIVLCAAYFGTKPESAAQALALGNSQVAPELGALAYQTFTAPALARAEQLRRIAEGKKA